MKIGIVGCAGRMGQMLLKTILATDGAEIGGGSADGFNGGFESGIAFLAMRHVSGVSFVDTIYDEAMARIDHTVSRTHISEWLERMRGAERVRRLLQDERHDEAFVELTEYSSATLLGEALKGLDTIITAPVINAVE